MADRILSVLGTIVQTAFWGFGYFFGFSLIGILSFGLLKAAPFTETSTPGSRYRESHRHQWWQVIYRRNGNFYLIAELVALVGWLVVGVVGWSLYWFSAT